MCEVSNLQTSPNSKKQPHFWGTFWELKLKKGATDICNAFFCGE